MDFEALCALALQQYHAAQYDAVLDTLAAILQLRPDYPEAIYYQGMALKSLKQQDTAIAKFSLAISLKPSFSEAYLERANLFFWSLQYDLAIQDYDAFHQTMDKASVDAAHNYSIALREMQRPHEAITYCNQVLLANPKQVHSRYLRGMCRLMIGDYSGGWDDFESRFLTWPNQPVQTHWHQQLWRGQEIIAGKTILLWGEQGQGDVFMFCRFVLVLRDRGAKVILQAHPALFDLMHLSFASQGVQVISTLDALPDFDFHSSVMSLAFACKIDQEDKIPSSIPYLKAEENAITLWRKRLDAASHERFGNKTPLRIGLVWAGGRYLSHNEQINMDLMRSMHLNQFSPLMIKLRNSQVEFHSLQKGDAVAQIQDWRHAAPPPIDWAHQLSDWTDTAALIANMDLVISVDTSTAHLAGAMGKPMWLLSRYNGCWRWLLDRTNSPWYPSMRIFRQPQLGDWTSVINQVGVELEAWAADRALS